ncbi:transmembrane protein 8B isoform X2 [Hemicordylus capensis]|uniref:transmembrane protein 8B isoform X2 n=1 Tax=Hemicordylus capensis TaxID=884348 RepID=UPI0023049CC8|nr:transmembrane protein 8B isoform X2 [Hemicordylus capensis]
MGRGIPRQAGALGQWGRRGGSRRPLGLTSRQLGRRRRRCCRWWWCVAAGAGARQPGPASQPENGLGSGRSMGRRAGLGRIQLLLLQLLAWLSLGRPAGGLFVTDYFTRTPRKLNPFRSFTSIELFHFRIPEDTVVAVWNLITFKEQGGTFGDQCPDRSITVYFRSGAPPVINPLGTHFPRETAVPGSFALTLTWTLPNRTTGVFNITSPLPGDWFLAAHLPKEQGKISVKGLAEDCQYLFQPQLIVQRLVGIGVLYPGYVSGHALSPHNRSLLYKVFIPSYTSRVLVQLLNCRGGRPSGDREGCPLWLKVRGKAPPLHNSTARDCRDPSPCRLALELPFWQHWYYLLVEKAPGAAGNVSFQLLVQLKDCSRTGLPRAPFQLPGSSLNMPHSFGSPGGLALAHSLPPFPPNSTRPPPPSPPTAGEHCWPIRPTLRNELDTFSVHFYIFFGPNVSVPPDRPAIFAVSLLPVLDSGSVLNLELKLNVSSLRGENATVFACLSHEVPLASEENSSVTCETELLLGFLLSINATAPLTRLRIPYPQTGNWYLSLRSLCSTGHGLTRAPHTHPAEGGRGRPEPEARSWSQGGWQASGLEPCGNVTAEVYLRTYLSPCINDCGPYGQCKLLRTNNYLYAACECKAGWSGWGCTDNGAAFSYGFQLLSTLLLCLSNLMFVPPVLIALRSHYLLEAAVYIFTMFFSTFYHACDQPGIVVFCIMDYDVLQFCDFLGSLMSVWVTVIAMARLQPVVKQVLYLLGAMLLSMALQLDRHGLWNLLGPSLFALGIMAIAWTARSIRRRRCYPPTWQRWTFYLLPGALIAASAVLLYAFVETEENYFYIHSIWHMLIAGSVGFLLPPQAKPEAAAAAAALPGPLPRRKGCGYQLCINEQEELGLVDPSAAGASVTSVCAS